jgi:peptide deformylase
MLHSRFSKSKNPATGWVFLFTALKNDLHGNPAWMSIPESAQVAKTEGCLSVHHAVECKEFSEPLQPPR